MGYFAWPDEVDTIVLPEGEVDIKKALTAEDMDKIEDHMVKVRLKPQALDKSEVTSKDFEEIEIKSSKQLLLQLCIKAWRGPGFVNGTGEAMPVTPENIAMLKASVRNLVLSEINARNKELKKV